LSQTEPEDLEKEGNLKKAKNERLSNQIDNNFIRATMCTISFRERKNTRFQ
jgi:hypothetical protein